jgi:hypothetical protein
MRLFTMKISFSGIVFVTIPILIWYIFVPDTGLRAVADRVF